MKNFNEKFGKEVTYDNIKSKKKQRFVLSLEDTYFEKPQVGGQIDTTTYPPPITAVLGLIDCIFHKELLPKPILLPSDKVSPIISLN